MMGARTCWNNRKRRDRRGSKTSSRVPEQQKVPTRGWIKTKKRAADKEGGQRGRMQ
jgi:hypothetical protein